MAKTKAKPSAGSGIRPLRSPVLSVRVGAELRRRIKEEGEKSGRNLSDTVAGLLELTFAYQHALGEFHEWQRKHAADIAEMEKGNIRAVLGRKGWRIGPHNTWVDPNSSYGKALPKSGFVAPEEAASPLPRVTLAPEVKEVLGEVVEAQLKGLEERLGQLEATLAKARLVVLDGAESESRKRA